MLQQELHGIPYIKAEVNRELRESKLAGRTKGSIEFRMQNISATLYDLKIPHIPGYLPAKNVGSRVKEKIKICLDTVGISEFYDFVPTAAVDELNRRVAALRLRTIAIVPAGQARPKAIAVTSFAYVRDPAVKQWVLQNCHGNCEGCNAPAPFLDRHGLPYLEAHHVMPLSSLGSDTTTNTVALCPNCHRRCHHAADREEFKLSLYEKIPRLKIEVPLSDDELMLVES